MIFLIKTLERLIYQSCNFLGNGIFDILQEIEIKNKIFLFTFTIKVSNISDLLGRQEDSNFIKEEIEEVWR